MGRRRASWTFSGLNPGQYRVWTTWVPSSNRVTDAAYTVLDGSTAVGTVAVNQQLTPSSLNVGGAWWQQLGGTYTISGNTLVVRLSDLADPAGAYLIADAVRIEWIGGERVGAAGPGARRVEHRVGRNRIDRPWPHRHRHGGDPELHRPQPGIVGSDTGHDLLAVGVQPGVGLRRDDAGARGVDDLQRATGRAAPGTFSGTVSFATSDPNQNPFSFTITGTASLVLTLDDTAGGFSATSDWLSYVGVGYQNEIRYKQVGSGSEPASWTFSGLNPGQYRVWTTWEPASNRVTDAAYTVLDGSTAVGTVAVNQQLTPSSLNVGGAWWQQLGGTVYHHREHAGRALERPGRSRGSVPDRRRRPHRVDRGGSVASDTTPPTVALVAPLSGATSVLPNANVTVTFSELMTATTITAGTFELRDPSGNQVAATVSYDAATLTATLDPVSPLAASSGFYTALVRSGPTGVKDLAGNPLATDFAWSFTTAVPPMTVLGSPTVDGNGVKYYSVVSAYLGAQPTTLRILEPTNPAPGQPHRFLYVLPVEPGVTDLSSQFGDGLEQARLLNLQNLYNLTLVAPSFPIIPWYGDNDINPDRRLESFVVKARRPLRRSVGCGGPGP